MLDLTKLPEKIRLELNLEDLLVFADKLLAEKETKLSSQILPEILTVEETSKFLNLAIQTVYQLTSRREIPFYKKNKRLYFKRSELLEWLNQGKQKTQAEFDAELTAHLISNSKKKER